MPRKSKYPIFVSHRHDEADIARFMKQRLTALSAGQLDVFISEELPTGEDWRKSLENALHAAKVLLLIYGDPSDDWSWCFYEVGFFRACRGPKIDSRKIICLKRPQIPVPEPIKDLQQPTEAADIEKHLQQMCKVARIKVDTSKISDFVGELVTKLTAPRFGTIRRIRCNFPMSKGTAEDRLPLDATLTAEPSVFRELFEYDQSEIKWAQITDMLHTSAPDQQIYDLRWMREIISVVHLAKKGKIRSPQCVLFARRGDLRYRFAFNFARKQENGGLLCEFLVIDEVGGPPKNMPASTLALMTTIRMAARIRYEIVLRRPVVELQQLSARDQETECADIRSSLISVLSEADARGAVNRANLLEAFESPEEKQRIGTLMNAWPPIAQKLQIDAKSAMFITEGMRAMFDHEEGAKQTMMQGDDGMAGYPDPFNHEMFIEGLKSLSTLNREFLARACKRLGEVTEMSVEEWNEAYSVIPN